ncbi:hypothetical protein AWJ20_4257 [Sugiyamaella lignohabitans]|uniref:Secreted protein n=1 Tax=Sugiyamaella lignohabitans TaxID=796027 RepID=A0A167CAX8_9ASCO|nr:uncharacterized protein AWJ20_4257 [Sugiyamaella lignohabitans]ANB11446.1 hypothetical protein AWJ20_4257 [Sugiyamaella lignohabitans]
MYIKASSRSRLTTSLFSVTFVIAVMTVASPQLLPCPARPGSVGSESAKKKKNLAASTEDRNEQWKSKDVVVIR